jgi:arylsulfatase A-like enzyme
VTALRCRSVVLRFAFAFVWLGIVPGVACKRASREAAPAPAASDTNLYDDDAGAGPVVLDMITGLDGCALGHRGVLVDFGDPSTQVRLRPSSLPSEDLASDEVPRHGGDLGEVVEYGGATWLRTHSRTLIASFYWPADASESPDDNAYVEGRVRGVSARAVAVTIDSKPVGKWTLTKGETTVVIARATTPLTLAPGGHELSLQFVGGSRGGDALAEIDWAHVGTGDPAPTYAAPTRADVLVDSTVGGKSFRALSLRAPAFVRCSGFIPADATVEASLATAGGGDAEVEARLLRDRRPPVVLGTARISGGEGGWAHWSVPITGIDRDGTLASIELVARHGGPYTRALFGMPRVVASRIAPRPGPPQVRSVLLVILGSTSERSLAPWGGSHPVDALSRWASSATLFTHNRASSSLPHAVVASMLTGLSPHALGMDDANARLPQGPTTLAEACRQAGLATAMFTANPMTGPAFGFDRGWSSLVMRDPLDEGVATRVFDDAIAWMDAHQKDRYLAVVHARGGHPPWDATPDELRSMPPAGYFGILEPHRAAEALAKAHKRPGHFKEEDRVRAWALYDRAIDTHDEALGRLLASIRAAGREDDTAVIVTGDVAAYESPPVPFVDVERLDEPLLATPLAVRWPHADALSGLRVEAATSPEDIAPTILAALRLAPPPTFQGTDLARIARGNVVPAERPMAATVAGRFAVRWGPFVLVGLRDREMRMCDLSLDPTCVADVRATSPLGLELLHRWANKTLTLPGRPSFPRDGVMLDEHTTAALVRWGRPTDRDNEQPPP